MELGLSLGGDSTTKNSNPQTQTNNTNTPAATNGGFWFCMALGNPQHSHDKPEKSTENEDKQLDGDGDDEDDGDDGRTTTSPVQLDLLPLAPVPRQTPWSDDDGSSDNNSSGNMGLQAARGIEMSRFPERVSSANSIGSSPFQMDFGIFGRGASGDDGGRNKRDLEVCGMMGNDVVEADRAGSRASDEDENGSNARKKLRLSKEQSAFLEESFKEHSTLNPKQKQALAKQLNLRPRQVEVWFQNRRARTKLKQTEVDCEYLKRCCETLTEENRRLHKELQELRALKTSNSFFMQLPATTLTMCPSCERVASTTSTSTATTTTLPPSGTALPTTSTATPKAATPFPISRPKFFPFSPTPSSHSHQSAAS